MGRMTVVIFFFFDLQLLIIVKGLISDPPCFICLSLVFFVLFFASSAQCPPCWTSSAVTSAAFTLGDSHAQRHRQHALISLPLPFAHFYFFFILLSCPSLCLCSPGCFLCLVFPLLSVSSKPLSPLVHLGRYFLLLVRLCSFAKDSWGQFV